jgi:hypothetical protein
MSQLEETCSFGCPYCFQQLSINIDLTAGEKQEFVYDCEVCCHPIQISVEIEDGFVKELNCFRES